jgi:fumarylacetoacetate (FAA) hydrolase family protein
MVVAPKLATPLDQILPQDWQSAALAGRVWRPDMAGPWVVTIRGGDAIDISKAFPVMHDLCEEAEPSRGRSGRPI